MAEETLIRPSLLAAMERGDLDGMPDAWELKQGLNPKDPSDASRQASGSSYTYIEIYINSLVK
jgi:hypothetical protein